MSIVNEDALSYLALEHAEEARRIIDVIGVVSEELGAAELAQKRKLNKLREDLKRLISAINNGRYPVIQ